MLRCKNCGGNVVFNIERQDVECVFCGSRFPVSDYDHDRGAGEQPKLDEVTGQPMNFDPQTGERLQPAGNAEDPEKSQYYETVIHTCTQCGAQIITPDNAAVGFCSYCGTEAVLESRIARERRPAWIIPFKKSKQDCRDIYMKAIGKEPYIPKEFKDPEFIDKFRGIYIPYWEYKVGFESEPTFKVTEVYSEGDYNIHNEYTVTPKLGVYETEIPLDASSGFDDELAAAIAPFNRQKMVPFSPGYLAGLFADTADVAPQVYEREVISKAQDSAIKSIEGQFKGTVHADITADTDKRIPILGTKIQKLTSELCPVWFLTWRKGQRLAYAVINGETGKVFAEVPVDIGSFLLRSGLIAAVLFAILTIGGTLILPPTMVLIAAATAFAAQLLYRAEIRALRDKEQKYNDLGALKDMPMEKIVKVQKIREKKRRGAKPGCVSIVAVVIAIMVAVTLFVDANAENKAMGGTFFIVLGGLLTWLSCLKPVLGVKEKSMLLGMTLPLAAEILAFVVCAAETVEDWKFYGAAIICLAAVMITALSMILRYNRLCTRGIPDFHDRKGGARYEAG